MKTKNEPGTIVIVGASSGLGRGVAETLASQGCKVVALARRMDRLEELASLHPDHIFPHGLDVTDDDCVETFKRIVEEAGGMDAVLYAAGCGWNNPMLQRETDERTVDTNVVGFTRIINAAFDWFADRGATNGKQGHICAITSIAGTKGIGISATYSATKRYQNTYLEALRQLAAVRKVNVTVTDIRPGFIDTDLLDTKTHRYPMLMKVPYAVRRIVRAVLRHPRVAYVDWRWHLVVMGWKLIPSGLWARLKLKI